MGRGLLVFLLSGCLRASGGLERFEFARPAMGTEFRILLHAAEAEDARRAAEEAFARIHALDRALTDYDPASELVRLGARSDEAAPTEWIPLSEELGRVLADAQELARASHGAFDVTAGPYTQLWRRARRQGEAPRPERLAQAAPSVGHGKLELDEHTGRARLLAPHMRLDLGGIGKGFALDEAMAALARHGIERALVIGGGEMLAAGPPPGEAGWRVSLVGLDGTREAVLLAHAALATSGDLEQALVVDGRRHSHLLDPRTGAALTERRLVSVAGPRATLTDGLATALSVLGIAAGPSLLARYPGYEARLQVLTEAGIVERRSAAFPRPVSCVPARAAPPFVPSSSASQP